MSKGMTEKEVHRRAFRSHIESGLVVQLDKNSADFIFGYQSQASTIKALRALRKPSKGRDWRWCDDPSYKCFWFCTEANIRCVDNFAKRFAEYRKRLDGPDRQAFIDELIQKKQTIHMDGHSYGYNA